MLGPGRPESELGSEARRLSHATSRGPRIDAEAHCEAGIERQPRTSPSLMSLMSLSALRRTSLSHPARPDGRSSRNGLRDRGTFRNCARPSRGSDGATGSEAELGGAILGARLGAMLGLGPGRAETFSAEASSFLALRSASRAATCWRKTIACGGTARRSRRLWMLGGGCGGGGWVGGCCGGWGVNWGGNWDGCGCGCRCGGGYCCGG